MDFEPSATAASYREQVRDFIEREIEPAEPAYLQLLRDLRERPLKDRWGILHPMVDELRSKARKQGLWNLYLTDEKYGPGLSNLDYAPLAELMGRSVLAAEIFNCTTPDSGNGETLARFGSPEQRRDWLEPLLDGQIRSAFGMTEPDVASSDTRNLAATAALDRDEIVVNGRKSWSAGLGHPSCAFILVMARTEKDAPPYARYSMVIVPIRAAGVKVERMQTIMGYYDEPGGYGEVSFTDVRLPAGHLLGEPGWGFEIAQSRLGPDRVHHCMRLIGVAERALELACRRATSRVAFGRMLANLGGNRERIARARIDIEQARLLVLRTAWLLDTKGLVGALGELSQIKAAVPAMAQRVVDMAIQLHGGAGLSDDFPLASAWAAARSLRIADGPDEVHLGVVARIELAKYIGKQP